MRGKFARYDENPNCLFDEGREHFAVHVRMGDRRAFYDGNPEYFVLLETMMDTITEELRWKGSSDPLFHVFSETLIPCPSEATGLFEEFPTWPVKLDQVCSPFVCANLLERLFDPLLRAMENRPTCKFVHDRVGIDS